MTTHRGVKSGPLPGGQSAPLTVAELSGSPQARRALERTHGHLHIFRLHFERSTGHETLTEHAAVVEAIRSGDPAAAEAAMIHHLEAAMNERIRTIYDTDGPER